MSGKLRSSSAKPARRDAFDVNVSGADDDFAAHIRRAALHTLLSRGFRRGSLHIAVIGDARMRRLHAEWLGEDSTTDVLTFDLRSAPRRGLVDGELLVCSGVARRTARRRRGDWRTEILLYVVHGCLHLCGYDDESDSDAERMHALEDTILTELGWGRIYAGDANKTCVRRKR